MTAIQRSKRMNDILNNVLVTQVNYKQSNVLALCCQCVCCITIHSTDITQSWMQNFPTLKVWRRGKGRDWACFIWTTFNHVTQREGYSRLRHLPLGSGCAGTAETPVRAVLASKVQRYCHSPLGRWLAHCQCLENSHMCTKLSWSTSVVRVT